MPPELYTIGYEGVGLDAFVAALAARGIEVLVDVRAVAWSRKRGFAKSQLSAALAAAGIRYVHLQALGNPKVGREAGHAGDREAFGRIFQAHLAGADAQAALGEAAGIATASRACLLCLERDPATCHRTLVAREIVQRTGQRIVDLSEPARLPGV